MSSSLHDQNTCAHDHLAFVHMFHANAHSQSFLEVCSLEWSSFLSYKVRCFDIMVHKCLVHLFPRCLDAMLLQLFAFESTREAVLMDSAYICCHDAFPDRPLMCLSYCGSPKSSIFSCSKISVARFNRSLSILMSSRASHQICSLTWLFRFWRNCHFWWICKIKVCRNLFLPWQIQSLLFLHAKMLMTCERHEGLCSRLWY